MFPLPHLLKPVESRTHKAPWFAPPFVESWRRFVRPNVFHYGLLTGAERKCLRRDAAVLFADKTWEGCGGLVITDEIKVTIAAQACLMLLGREHDHFSRVQTILVYPSAFELSSEHWQEQSFSPVAAAGVAVPHGPVILAWDAVLEEGRTPELGRNVVIHEFAHELDFIDGYAGGTLDLDGEEGERWQEIVDTEYRRLQRDLRRGRETFLGDYAAASKTEFFATASELFFTLPERLRHYHPGLYEALAATYALDPAAWFARTG